MAKKFKTISTSTEINGFFYRAMTNGEIVVIRQANAYNAKVNSWRYLTRLSVEAFEAITKKVDSQHAYQAALEYPVPF